jgi:citrate synthase
MSAATAANNGLEGVVVAETAISDVDGDAGKLVIAGVDVEQLATTASYEAAATRVLGAGGVPDLEVGDVAAAIGQARVAAFELLPSLGQALAVPDGMDALRGGMAQLRATGDDRADAIAAIGAMPVLAAAWARGRAGGGGAPIRPDPTAGHAADFLAMLGRPGTAAQRRALDAYFVTVIDHGMNASTFTSRVIASTGSDLISAVVGGIGALKGPLHGGAPGPVLDMLDAIGEPEHAEAWLLGELAAGRRIMGMGHRVYRVRDPRAAVLETAVKDLAGKRLALARGVETAAAKILRERKPDRPLAANVEFYTAVLLDAAGLDREAFSPAFAIGRVAGWSAHVIEQRRTGRLIRPASRYIGA